MYLKFYFWQIIAIATPMTGLVAHPSQCNSNTQSGKLTVTFEPMMQFINFLSLYNIVFFRIDRII